MSKNKKQPSKITTNIQESENQPSKPNPSAKGSPSQEQKQKQMQTTVIEQPPSFTAKIAAYFNKNQQSQKQILSQRSEASNKETERQPSQTNVIIKVAQPTEHGTLHSSQSSANIRQFQNQQLRSFQAQYQSFKAQTEEVKNGAVQNQQSEVLTVRNEKEIEAQEIIRKLTGEENEDPPRYRVVVNSTQTRPGSRLDNVREFSASKRNSFGLKKNKIEQQPQLINLFSDRQSNNQSKASHVSQDKANKTQTVSWNLQSNNKILIEGDDSLDSSQILVQERQSQSKEVRHRKNRTVNNQDSENISISPPKRLEERFIMKTKFQTGPQLQQKHNGTQSLSSHSEESVDSAEASFEEENILDRTQHQGSPSKDLDFKNLIIQNKVQMLEEAMSEIQSRSSIQDHKNGLQIGSSTNLQEHTFGVQRIANNQTENVLQTEMMIMTGVNHQIPPFEKLLIHERQESVLSMRMTPINNNPKISANFHSPSFQEKSISPPANQIYEQDESADKNLNNTDVNDDEHGQTSNLIPRQTNYKSNQSKVSSEQNSQDKKSKHNKINSMNFQSPVQRFTQTQANEQMDTPITNIYERAKGVPPSQLHQQNVLSQQKYKNAAMETTYQDEESFIINETQQEKRPSHQMNSFPRNPSVQKQAFQYRGKSNSKFEQQQSQQENGVKSKSHVEVMDQSDLQNQSLRLQLNRQDTEHQLRENNIQNLLEESKISQAMNKAFIPQKKDMNFEHLNNPHGEGEDSIMRFQSLAHSVNDDKIYVVPRFSGNYNLIDLGTSSEYWDPKQIRNDLLDNYTAGTKSIQLSVTHKNEMDYNNNFIFDEAEASRFNIYEQTPKQKASEIKRLLEELSIKQNLVQSIQENHKQSIVTENNGDPQFTNQNRDFDDFNTQDFPTIGNDEDLHIEGNGINRQDGIVNGTPSKNTNTKRYNSNVSRFQNTQYTQIYNDNLKSRKLEIENAKLQGARVRKELCAKKLQGSGNQYEMPEGMSIVDQSGPLIINEELEHISGVTGSKIILGAQNFLAIRNHQSIELRISALQFEFQSHRIMTMYDTPREPAIAVKEQNLIHILVEEDQKKKLAPEYQRTLTIKFEDCAFLIDQTHLNLDYEDQELIASDEQCKIAIKITNLSSQTNLDVIFQNCAFLGFHHSIICNTPNVSLSILNCMFKRQSYESIVAIDLSHLQISNSIFKKSCTLDSYRAAVSLIHYQDQQKGRFTNQSQNSSPLTNRRGGNDQQARVVNVLGCNFRKCFGVGLQIVGQERETQRLKVQIKETKFEKCQGQSGLRFENISADNLNRFENRESNIIQLQSKDAKNQARLVKKQKTEYIIKLANCEFTQCKRNGLELNNVFCGFQIKSCLFKENKDSGIYVNQQKSDSDTVVCSCALKQASSPFDIQPQLSQVGYLLSNRPSLSPSPSKSETSDVAKRNRQ